MTRTLVRIAAGAVAAATVAAGVQLFAQVAATRPDEITITSAIFGAAEGSADVTPVVTKLAAPGLGEFLAAPRFMRVDPARGSTKDLVIHYQYKGEPHLFSTTEPGVVSQAILVEHATGAIRPAVSGASTDALVIVNSFYGPYARDPAYLPVTAKLGELLRPDADPFVIGDEILGATVGTGPKNLVVISVYRGIRSAFYAERGQQINYAMLVANAEAGGDPDKHASDPPPWLKDAQPDPPLDPGQLGPGLGPSPRRELGIAALLKALAELQAMTPTENDQARTTKVIALVRQSLADAQRGMRVPYPPPASTPVPAARNATNAARLATIARALQTAADELGQANPAQGGDALAKSIQGIKLALVELAGGGLSRLRVWPACVLVLARAQAWDDSRPSPSPRAPLATGRVPTAPEAPRPAPWASCPS